jgi:hypothetical protein
MNDGNRVYPVNKLIMHHAVSDDMVNWDDLQVQDWFSNIGKARGYSNGAVASYHEHPSRPGQMTYSMAHYCLHRYTKDGNKYGWRLTELIKNPFQQVAWHCGNWSANQTSIGIETAGNFSSSDIDDKALQLVADTLAKAWDDEIGGKLEVYGHKDWFATACPGRIYNKLDQLIDQINNQVAWTNRLFPAPPPPSTPKPTTRPVPDAVKLPKKIEFLANLDKVEVWDLTTNPNYKSTKTLSKGEPFVAYAKIPFNDIFYYVTEYSFNKGWKHGVNQNDVHEKPVVVPPVVDPPKEEPPVVTPPVEPPKEDPKDDGPTDYDKEQDNTLKQILAGFVAFFTVLGQAVADLLSKLKKDK